MNIIKNVDGMIKIVIFAIKEIRIQMELIIVGRQESLRRKNDRE